MAAKPSSSSDPVAFFDSVEERLRDLAIEASKAEWVQATFITDDTQALAARAGARLIAETVRFAKEGTAFPAGSLAGDTARKAHLLRNSMPLIAPTDPGESKELTETVASLQAMYSKGTYRPEGRPEPLDLQGLSRILAESQRPEELRDAWTGWHSVARPMRRPFERYVELANRGARELGFADTGEMWRSKYDMEPAEFDREAERIWLQVRPFYQALHAFVRWKLAERYGAALVPSAGPIRAELLGNMWGQSWEYLQSIVDPDPAGPSYDLTEILRKRGTTPTEMVRYGERFFTSLGFPELPATFWERSLFTRPRDREVVCHASAWDVDLEEDLRIKMCIEITGEDFRTIHHELGHNFYQRAYRQQPLLFRDSANDGFHEAVGDAIALSVTPEYLQKIGLLDGVPDAGREIGLLLGTALEKVSFLPFGYLVDRWRWEVFSGAVGPSEYNRRWWELKLLYQGIVPPAPRSEAEFDPGAKYHVAANVPYMRYFLAHLLQFQFHRSLLRSAGWTGPLHRGSIYGDREAGRRLSAMLSMGASRPWPDALEALTGERRIDAGALLEYFAPLTRWLDEQNRGHPVDW